MRTTKVLTALFIATLVIASTFTSVPAIFGVDLALAQQSATYLRLVKDAPREIAEIKKQPIYFLKDLDEALAKGCDALYLHLGWPAFDPQTRVCLHNGGGITTELIVRMGGT